MITLEELNCETENINLDRYMDFIDDVKQDMQYPEWLVDLSREDVEKLLENKTKIWLYSLKDRLVCSMMLLPTTKEMLESYELFLFEDDVANYGQMFVHPEYTGNHLQLQMLKKMDKYSMDQGFKYALCRVHQDNFYAIDNLEKDNFVFKKRKQLEVGIRDIYIKEYEKETN